MLLSATTSLHTGESILTKLFSDMLMFYVWKAVCMCVWKKQHLILLQSCHFYIDIWADLFSRANSGDANIPLWLSSWYNTTWLFVVSYFMQLVWGRTKTFWPFKASVVAWEPCGFLTCHLWIFWECFLPNVPTPAIRKVDKACPVGLVVGMWSSPWNTCCQWCRQGETLLDVQASCQGWKSVWLF